MKNQDLHKLKVFAINSYRILKRRQDKFFEELEQEKKANDRLTVKQVTEQYSLSSKTIYRWRNEGLKCLQNGPGGKLLIRREDLENFKSYRYGRSV